MGLAILVLDVEKLDGGELVVSGGARRVLGACVFVRAGLVIVSRTCFFRFRRFGFCLSAIRCLRRLLVFSCYGISSRALLAHEQRVVKSGNPGFEHRPFGVLLSTSSIEGGGRSDEAIGNAKSVGQLSQGGVTDELAFRHLYYRMDQVVTGRKWYGLAVPGPSRSSG